MQRIWQVRPKSQGKGNDVREAEGRSTAQLPAPPWAPHPPQTCSARLLRLGRGRALCACHPVSSKGADHQHLEKGAGEPGAGLRWGKGSENE